jgi:cell division protein FtsQ
MMQATRRSPASVSIEPKKRLDLPWASIARHAAVNLLVIAGAAGMVLGGVDMVKHWQKRTAIASIQVVGDVRRINTGDIAARLDHNVAGGYFTANLGNIRQAAMQSPWVENAVVSRQWPDVVRVQLSERQPVARWGEKGLISSRGEVFVPPELIDADSLPILFGPPDKAHFVMEQYRVMNGILRELNLHIVALELTDRMGWMLRLDNGIELVVDRVDTIPKMQRFAYLYQRQLAPDVAAIASVDLRYRNGIAVGWKLEKSLKNAKSGV